MAIDWTQDFPTGSTDRRFFEKIPGVVKQHVKTRMPNKINRHEVQKIMESILSKQGGFKPEVQHTSSRRVVACKAPIST
jgi:hypothetical protein